MSRGIQRERQLRHSLEADDWIVIRAAGSLGCADLVALKDGRTPMMIECKATARGPYAGFPPAKRKDLRQVAEWAGADAWLVWWPPRGKATWLPWQSWPA
jgi:Holliday junction resolvase